MSYSATPCHPTPCYTAAHYDCCSPQPWTGYQQATPCVVLLCPVPAETSRGCSCREKTQTVPYELTANSESSSQEALVGGKCEVHLSLEYLADGDASASAIDITIEADGTTSTWNESPLASGYQVKDGFATVQPGSRVTLSVTEATAKLRWCETICC